MPLKVNIEEQLTGAFLKLRVLLSFSGTESEEFFSEDYVINDLAIVRLNINDSPTILSCSMLTRGKTDSDKVKVKVSCQEMDEAFYSEWICTNSWKLIGKRQNCDISLDNVCTCLLNFNIYAEKVEDNFLVNLFKDTAFTDFNLTAVDGSGSIAVHRAHLAAHSNVFQAMLTREWKETTEGRIQIEGVCLQTLQHFKEFMYLRTLPNEGLKPLLLFASYYLIDDLKSKCISTLALNCQSRDWNGLLEFATKNQIFELIRAIMVVNPTISSKDEGESEENDNEDGRIINDEN